MSTITREHIANLIEFNSEGSDCQANAEQWEVHELARIALASREAEKSILYRERNPYNGLTTGWQELTDDEYEFIKDNAGENAEFRTVYTAQPAPVVHQEPIAWLNDAYLSRGVVDGEAGSEDAGPGYIPVYREPLYAVQPAPVSVPTFDEWLEIRGNKPLGWVKDAMRESYDACRAAMLKGAERVATAYKLPFEQWLSQQTGTIDVECGCVMTEVFFHWLRVAYEAGNSPVIPDGWVLVPVEPTEHMIVEGFESWPDEFFSDTEVWEAFQEMSGCQQSAHLAKLCWAAMIAAAPQQEVKS